MLAVIWVSCVLLVKLLDGYPRAEAHRRHSKEIGARDGDAERLPLNCLARAD